MAFKEALPVHAIPLDLGHHEIIQRVEFQQVVPLDDSGPLVRLCASVQAHPDVPAGPGRHLGATTLAIRMDQAAAISLVQQICETGRRMGWRMPPLNGTPNEGR